MAIVHKDMDKDLEEKLVVFELIFLACYIMEAILKLAASGSALYWGALENRFDLFVISTSRVFRWLRKAEEMLAGWQTMCLNCLGTACLTGLT